MKRSKSQVLYNALPGAYISYSSGPANALSVNNVVIKINYWETNEMDISDKAKITSQIIPDILAFQNNEFGSVDNKLLNLISNEYREKVKFVEVKPKKDDKNKKDARKNDVQIYGNIDPKLFYCSECGQIKYVEKNSDIKNMKCDNDKCSRKGKPLYQYNRVFVCECGESYPIFVDNKKYKYFADEKDGFYNVRTRKTEKIPFVCENCGRNCILINATDSKAFFPRIITSVKLTENDYPDLCNSKEGRNLIIDYYLGKKGKQEFKSCAQDLKEKEDDSYDDFFDTDDTSEFNPENYLATKTDNEYDFDENVVYKILEYNSLKEKVITDMKTAVENSVKYSDSSLEELNSMLKKLKIANIFSVGDIEIIDTAYAYTRRYQSFEDIGGSSEVRLRAFENKKDNRPVFYNIKTNTEGIVIDIDKRDIYNYLKYKFGDKCRFRDFSEKDLSMWFLENENVDYRLVKKFEDINVESGSLKSLYTQCVYQLLHTISHMFINTISKFCGIDKSSLSEMIFLNACSILIYSQTSQGAVLGALSQTFDKNLYNILKHTYNDNSVCAFDPLCMDTSNGSCCACSYLDEVACEHFNKDLSRRLLYGYKSADGNCDVKGFWEDM